MAKGLEIVYDSLSTLLAAGVPLVRSLKTVAAGQRGRLQKALSKMIQDIQKGMPLTDAMAEHPKVFAQLDIIIIRVAEESGSIAESFDLLAKWYAFSKRITRISFAGLLLPILMAHFAGVLGPAVDLVRSDWDFAAFIRSAILTVAVLCYIPAAIIICATVFKPRTGPFRRLYDLIALHIPFFLGRAIRKLALSRFCWIFHITSKAGLPITQCADLAVKGMGNTVLADMFRPALLNVRAGNPFSERLSAKLPFEFVEPWRVAEETGQLEEASKRLADKNGEDAEFWFKQFATWFARFYYGVIMVVMIIMVFRGYGKIYGDLLRF